MSDVFKALAHPVRREVLKRLRNGPLPAGEIAAGFAVSAPTMSGHLAALKEAGLVDAERQGTSILYRLNLSVLEEAIAALMSVAGIGWKETGDDSQRADLERGADCGHGGDRPVGGTGDS